MTTSGLLGVRSHVAGIVWPPLLEGVGAMLAAYVHLLERSEWLAPAELEAHQREQLTSLVRHHVRHTPTFKARLKRAGISASDLTDPRFFRRLPPIRRRDIQLAGDAFFSTSVPESHEPVGTSETSGSTGEPVRLRRTAVNQIAWLGANMRDHLWHRRDFSKPTVAVRATLLKPQHQSDWGPPASLLYATGPALGVPIMQPVAEQFADIQAFGPATLTVYPNVLAELARHAEANDLRLETLSDIRTMAETLTPEIRALATRVFGVPIHDGYSSQELGTIALQCPASGLYHIMAESLMIEVVDAAGKPCLPGAVGRIVATDLHNFASPVIRYETGDHAEAGPSCPCGRGLPTLTRILGRDRNMVLLENGRRYWPIVDFTGIRDIAPVLRYQVIQQDVRRVDMCMVVERPLTAEEEARLGAFIVRELDHPFDIRFVYFDGDLPRAANGKFEQFVCRAVLPAKR